MPTSKYFSLLNTLPSQVALFWSSQVDKMEVPVNSTAAELELAIQEVITRCSDSFCHLSSDELDLGATLADLGKELFALIYEV